MRNDGTREPEKRRAGEGERGGREQLAAGSRQEAADRRADP
jgi:hypothetical protein